MAGLILVIGLWLAAMVAGIGLSRRARLWRAGRPAPIDWRRGLAALPRRYLVDVHRLVARKPAAARMHALVAGGFVAGSALLALGIVPGLRVPAYWALVALAFVVMIAGAWAVRARRRPVAPASLSAGRFTLLPLLLLAYAGGTLGVAVDGALGSGLPGALALAPALFGLFGLAAQAERGPLRHALAGALHLAAHPRPARFAGGRDTALRPLDLEAPKLGTASAGDFAWNRLLSFDACVQCGACEDACPAFAAGQPLNPKRLVQDLAAAMDPAGDLAAYAGSPHPGAPAIDGRCGPAVPVIGHVLAPETLWSCTTCRACVEACPMMIEHVDAIVDLRRFEVLEAGRVPDKAVQPLSDLRLADEPGGRPLAARLDFAAGLDLPLAGPREVDVLLWLGEGAFDLRHGRVLRALVTLMRRAGIDFAILGEAERDCGDLARRLGDEATFQRLARENIAALNAVRFRRLVTADPHALHVIRNEYPAFGGHFTVQHHSSLLDELVAGGRLPLAPVAGQATYHDPCYLGRYNGEFAAPRRLLAALGLRLVEMERHGPGSRCCGGGGGAPLADTPGTRRIPDMRMADAAATGTPMVAVACPGCANMLEGVAAPRPAVRDLAELALAALAAEPLKGAA
ncbi:DUF3483 domain-containing protein [Zavarzinia compransoris]|uniref:(Fe-S)-binding protein n=1 Tax=Zavarzinia compransoris TaxID=1264899 RepID=A0A317DVR8_9PROT|nr:DUF3483 domain-containing protein [Zavarzinia compransoris]PWR18060.1 (Fe-S)-binding protein [Zavarzinia compransoris]TDP43468.1 Fe-S oxidoreductase [Zavarzinia compransoris]